MFGKHDHCKYACEECRKMFDKGKTFDAHMYMVLRDAQDKLAQVKRENEILYRVLAALHIHLPKTPSRG